MSATAAFFLLAALPIGHTPDAVFPSPAPHVQNLPPDDACLCDVSFVDPRHGWAVGDHGTILHTDDGGQRWSQQPSGVVCTLNSVCFVDARIGWAAGGMAWPFLHDTSGVVLATRDGGRTWLREPVLLPALHKIRFVSDRQGWAIGCSSSMYPGGVFVTRDGGRSWQPAASGGAIGLTTGDLYDGRNAILGGPLGRLATISLGDFGGKANATTVLRGVNAMQTVPPNYGWMAGDGGWIALTGDGGNSWRPPLGKPPACAALFDFAAMAVRGGTCWLAGSPGSRIFSTPDAGRTWSAAPTGIAVPLRAIAFADDKHGWAVGQLGTVLATSDGGQTWQRQRAAGARAALMAVAGRADDLPLELIARSCKDQGYFGVGEVIGREDVNSGRVSDAPLADRLHQAMLRVGGCGGEVAWGFPARPAELQLPPQTVLEEWNRYHSGHAADALLAHLVRQIRTWRPDVLVVSAGREGDGLAEVVRQSVVAAIKLAADPAYLPDQFQSAGCGPWNVQRAYLVSDPKLQGTTALAADDWSPRLGQSWTDAALPARVLLANEIQPAPAAIGVQLVEGAGVPALAGYSPSTIAAQRCPGGTPAPQSLLPAIAADIMSGVDSTRGGSARRAETDALRPHSGAMDGLAQRRQIESAFQHLEQEPQSFLARLAKGDELPRGIDAAEAAVLTFRVADRLCHSGRWDLADKAFSLLIERYPDDPLARTAIVWRLQYMANVSGTLRVPMEGGTRSGPDTLLFARQIEMAQPDLFASPMVRYPLAAVYRRQGQDAQAERLYILDHRGVDRDAWWNCARGEQWLLDRKGPPPRPKVSCVAASERPHLDGRLDKPIWKRCTPIELKSPQGDDRAWPAKVLLAHDDKFLYVAVQCRQASGARYETTSQPRPRDPDLSQHDRVDICLDVDRTYASYYRLTIDHRGWAADACCGDLSWNPKWFVAAKTADGAWTAEAAIPLAELGAAIVPGKTVWAVGVQRTAPGVGFQSWTTPAAPQVVPEGFGWVGFE
jgi:photosystem II stability/assembly factor-like uncharacterized protein